ncbi:hypothetical protein LJ207_04930 [Halanaerobium sp. Z-7514]|uniref:Uncharacterized protein n=1 Tax=Halanaerobium polyolivorans TaxID=2886943 RepID=A0AAW4WZN7_9FIRM|nr:hypothetical protein [Halanaerobium polyolivorans]MCC3144669.1 hypothetical protein [Halanaerobium polyolivorans]RQD73258.1 MAG: hypothetical protein D5S01_08110 [Halanaerobium sp. MSAO_Bac5]
MRKIIFFSLIFLLFLTTPLTAGQRIPFPNDNFQQITQTETEVLIAWNGSEQIITAAEELKLETALHDFSLDIKHRSSSLDLIKRAEEYLRTKQLEKIIDFDPRLGENEIAIRPGGPAQSNEAQPANFFQFESDKLFYPLTTTFANSKENLNIIIISDQALVNFKGVKEEEITKRQGSYSISKSEVAYISSDIAELFAEGNITIHSWGFTNKEKEIDSELIISSNIEELFENSLERNGNKFVDVYPHPDYPFSVEEEIESLSGVLESRMGSRTYPWFAYTVDDLILLNAKSKELLGSFAEEGEYVTIKGYRDGAKLFMREPLSRELNLVDIGPGFYVTEIEGWDFYTGRLVLNDGSLARSRSSFWIPQK